MGPLTGVRVVEMAGIGPGPFCAMMLSDMGAEVLRVERRPVEGAAAAPLDPIYNPGRAGVLNRGRRSVGLDLKKPGAVEAVLRLIGRADALIEGFRPGVMERLGLGPDVCEQSNPRLVYGRMSGWGQHGPLARAAGHDINYISLSGALHAIGPRDSGPVPPLNLVGDFGGGGMFLAFGIVCALLEARTSGRGQVVDAAMCDGAATLMNMIYGFRALGQWSEARGSNLLDGGAPFYGAYRCADGRYLSIGPLEPQFYAELLRRCGVDDPELADASDPSRWPRLRERMHEVFATRSRDEWCRVLEGSDACYAPVLDLEEAPRHPHNLARGVFTEEAGVVQANPAPRFSRTPGAIQGPPPLPGEHTETALADWGFSTDNLSVLRSSGAI
jgi:alpha-methylacyl-CoA racemase